MRPGLVPTKMFAVVQACALPHIAVLEKNVSSIWFRQAEMTWNVFSQIPSTLLTSVPIYFLRITNSLLPITLSRKPAFCVCVVGLCPTLLLTGLWFMYSVISAALASWQGRFCISHTPDCGSPHWIPGVSLNPNICGYLPVSLSPPFFPLLLFSLPSSLLFHSLLPPHFFNPFFPLCLPFFLNFCIFFSLQENVSI